MKKHGIGWLNVPGYKPETWNPIVGCSKISEGCRNCYAERQAYRNMLCLGSQPGSDKSWATWHAYETVCAYEMDNDGKPYKSLGWYGGTARIDHKFDAPLKRKKPTAYFVCSMSDLLHETTPDEWILKVWNVMRACPQHLFIVLTKRAERMADFVPRIRFDNKGEGRVFLAAKASDGGGFPLGVGVHGASGLPWVWLGVTAENQESADERIPHLLRCPAARRFVSVEPMIGQVSLRWAKWHNYTDRTPGYCHSHLDGARDLDWIICGGESGPGARAMHPDWARSLRDQCQAANVPFFFKQWGDKRTRDNLLPIGENSAFGKRRGGDVLDGLQWHEWPEVDS